MLIKKLPDNLEDAKVLLKRRDKAKERKDMWRDSYREAMEYTMPNRETFTWHAPGQRKNRHLYDSTGQQCTYLAANNMQALLTPSWKHWAALSPGGDIDEETAESKDVLDSLQEATATLFHYINHSNFATVIPEAYLDLMVGTCAIDIDEGEPDDPLVFDSVPLSVVEIEEGPRGSIETSFMCRKIVARNLSRMYPGLKDADLPAKLREKAQKKPDADVSVIQCLVYNPDDRHYYGIAIAEAEKEIFWRYDYETSSPRVIGRASVVSGEIYGRGRVMVAMPDIKTLDAMQEYLLRQAALVVAPPMTGVSDGVLNPYTAQLIPNSIIPVASNDRGNPSLQALQLGGNFPVTDAIMETLRMSVRRILLGERNTDGRVHSATEVAIDDRNRLWDMGAEFGRIQAEVLSKIVARAVFILQKQGKMPPIKVDGKQVTLKYQSPLAKAQDQEDLIALQQSFEVAAMAANVGGQAAQAQLALGFKLEKLPLWLSKRTGLDVDLVRDEDEQKQAGEQIQQMAQQQQPQ